MRRRRNTGDKIKKDRLWIVAAFLLILSLVILCCNIKPHNI